MFSFPLPKAGEIPLTLKTKVTGIIALDPQMEVP